MVLLVYLLFILLLLAFPFTIAGLVKPKLLHFLFRKIPSRKLVLMSFILTFIVLSLSIGTIVEKDRKDFPDVQNQITAPTPSMTVKKFSPKPTSSDPCEQFKGTDQMQNCVQMQNAMEKGQELKYPLKATVTHDTYGVNITNLEATEWDQCTASLDDQNPNGDYFVSDGFIVKPGQTETVSWGNFANFENVRFNYFQTKPSILDLECVVGGQVVDQQTGAFSGGKTHRSIFNF